MVTLDEAWAKLDWAKKNFKTLQTEIETFEQADKHTIECQVDADAGKYTFYVRGLDAPDPEWGLRFGDCIHNARTALDYLIVRLVALVSGQTPADIDWI